MSCRRAFSAIASDKLHLRDFMPVSTSAGCMALASAAEPNAAAALSTSGCNQLTEQQNTRGANSVYLRTYGCQMNVSDSELVHSILTRAGYHIAEVEGEAGIVLLNTCAIREKAEAKIWGRLHELRQQGVPIVGLLGCMAERLKEQLLDSGLVHVVAGPDAYRDLPKLLGTVQAGAGTAINVQLSRDETYADVVPTRPSGRASAFVSITRGCNNMCSFCIVPYTRGRERSREMASILDEVRRLRDDGVKQVTLLGQNVNSYADFSRAKGCQGSSDVGLTKPLRMGSPSLRADSTARFAPYAEGFASVYAPQRAGAAVFAELLDRVAEVDPEMRVRFMSPHPKDFGADALDAVAAHANVCKLLHMPAQSGSTTALARMRRGYSRVSYDTLLSHARAAIPAVSFSTDIIVGFCGESEAEHMATLDLLTRERFPLAFLFAYSRRERTHAARHLQDDVPAAVKKRRLAEAMAAYVEGNASRQMELRGTRQLVLVESVKQCKDGGTEAMGRSDGYHMLRFEQQMLPIYDPAATAKPSQALWLQTREAQVGDYVAVDVMVDSRERLRARPLGLTTLQDFVRFHGSCYPGHVGDWID